MESDLDKMFEDFEKSFHNEFSGLFYHVKVSQVKSSFYVLIKKKREMLFGEKRQQLFDKVRDISENIYKNYARNSARIMYQYFPYYKLIHNYGNYHFHFFFFIFNYLKVENCTCRN